jgi:ribosomal-protein-alanine N-acetyltransferase
MNPSQLVTSRLYLRSACKGDEKPLFDNYCSDKEQSKFLAREAHINIEQTLNFLKTWGQSAWENHLPDFAWVIALKETNEPIGVFIVKLQNQQAQIHFGISRNYERLGYITEAGSSVIEWLRSHNEIKEIWTECDFENYASIKVLEKLGFINMGIKKNGLYLPAFGKKARDCYRYAII